MAQAFTYKKTSINEWIQTEPNQNPDALRARATLETVQKAMAAHENVTVVSAAWEPAHGSMKEQFHVVLREEGYGTSPATINVYCPLDWNGRFLACVGGGVRTLHLYEVVGRERRIAMPFSAIANGFATANTDGGVAGDVFRFGFNKETKNVDYELIINLAYRSTHTMSVLAKEVITAVYGEAPAYSYMQGASNGGRQTLTEAQCYPEDFDGFWAADPAINWNEMVAADAWGFTVMKSENHIVAPGKMDVFRREAIRQNGGRYDFIETAELPVFDPASCIGMESKDGVITAEDARVMKLIFDGPTSRCGHSLWYGFRPGTHFWSSGSLGETGGGCHIHRKEDDTYEPVMNGMFQDILNDWITRDPEYDWAHIDYKKFEDIYRESIRVINCLASNSPDLYNAKQSGVKILLTHAVNDDTIPSDGTLDYYKRVVEFMGGEAAVQDYLRFFMTPGGGHTDMDTPGMNTSLAEGMTVLMKWVEEGIVPDTLEGVQFDFDMQEALLTGNVTRYTLDAPSKCIDIAETPAYQKRNEFDPTQKFTVKSTIREIQADPEGKAILDKYAGGLFANPAMAMMLDAGIGQLQKLMPNKEIQDKLAAAMEELATLKKEARVKTDGVYGKNEV